MLENYIINILLIIFALDLFFTVFVDDDNNDNDVLSIIDNSEDSNSPNYQIISFNDIEVDDIDFQNEEDLDAFNFPPVVYEYDNIKNCKSLMNEFYSCLSKKNDDIYNRCQMLYNENILEKCRFIYSNNSFEKIKMQYHNMINKEKNDIEDTKEFLNEFDWNIDESDNEGNIEIELEEKNNDFNSKNKEKEKEKFIIINDKDCVEYGLSRRDPNYIVCTKYE
jgi:hypothetical protein